MAGTVLFGLQIWLRIRIVGNGPPLFPAHMNPAGARGEASSRALGLLHQGAASMSMAVSGHRAGLLHDWGG